MGSAPARPVWPSIAVYGFCYYTPCISETSMSSPPPPPVMVTAGHHQPATAPRHIHVTKGQPRGETIDYFKQIKERKRGETSRIWKKETRNREESEIIEINELSTRKRSLGNPCLKWRFTIFSFILPTLEVKIILKNIKNMLKVKRPGKEPMKLGESFLEIEISRFFVNFSCF